ncbi:hypothetical protein O181_040220 [Austropuccinia psidii MF-1]|uniref:Uncharacterized protein n=1 Tax=Austropuccinia psidii MF-1 TaxID=1389203 RepID=A0A9Q3DCT6_9BASI|nr:hypothetical protein [Austropuccinia psidii MF-1]
MTIVHKALNIQKNNDGLSRWALPNTPANPAYVPTSAEPQIPIEGINITDVGAEFFEEVRESYKQDKNFYSYNSIGASLQDLHQFFHRQYSLNFGKGWNPKLPVDNLKKNLVDIHPTASSNKFLLDKVRHHANQSMNGAFDYAKQEWDRSHKTPEFKVGDLLLVSTLSFNNIEGQKEFKDSFVGPIIIKALHGTNAVQVELSGELENKNPNFRVSLVKRYTSSDK